MAPDTNHPLKDAAAELLGGEEVLGRLETQMDVHLALQEGLPASAWTHLRSHLRLIEHDPTARWLTGSMPKPTRRLSRRQSSRLWALAKVVAKASDALGSSAAALVWLVQPAMALNRRRPIDLLSTSVGAQMVDDHLTRLEFGVYT